MNNRMKTIWIIGITTIFTVIAAALTKTCNIPLEVGIIHGLATSIVAGAITMILAIPKPIP